MGRTKRRAVQREKERRQRRQRLIAGVVGVIAVIAVIMVIIATRPVQVDIEGELLTRYAGIPVTFTDRGFPRLGNPEAPARVVEYSSFDCPSCRNFHDTSVPTLIERVRAGEISFTYVPVWGTGSVPNGERAARAAVCAGEQERFFEYHDLLFEWQGTYVASAFQPARLEAGAAALGLDVDAFKSCLNSAATSEVLDNARAAFAQSGGTGTPTIQINDELVPQSLAAVVAQIDVVLATSDPVTITYEAPAEDSGDTPTEDAPIEDAAATEES